MQTIEHLLGQDVLIRSILDEISQPDVRAVRLTGAAGAGKSYVARAVAQQWREQGGTSVVAVGDDAHATRELYPLLVGLSQAPRDWASVASTGGRSATRVVDTATGSLGIGGSIFDLLAVAFRQRIDRALRPYSTMERDIVLDLRRLTRKGELLLVADNCHWWDPASLNLVGDVLGDGLRESVPRLRSVQVLIVDTAGEQSVTAPDAFAALTSRTVSSSHSVARCTPEQFRSVLRQFGMQELPDDVDRSLFRISQGHLKLAQQIAAYAETADVQALGSLPSDQHLTALVAARFASLGPAQGAIADLLRRSAVLGLSFTETDLVCITGIAGPEVRGLVERAESIGFIERAQGRINFTHDIIRAAILTDESAGDLRTLYGKLAECLAVLRPGDFDARAHASSQAGDVNDARDMIALARVSQMRRGVPTARVLRRAVTDYPDDGHLLGYLTVAAEANELIAAGHYAGAIPMLSVPVTGETTRMAAERNYLLALCAMLLQTVGGAAQARAILQSWLPSLRDEPDIELRFLLLLQQGQLISEMFDEARETERALERRLLDRSRFDPEAAVLLQVQNRRAGAIDVPDIAELRIRAAVAFFQRGTADAPRDRLELFRSLTNLAAVELRLGRDDDAYQHALEAERVAVDSPEGLQRLDVLANDLVLAGLRSNAFDVAGAIARQRMIVDGRQSEDRFLERCNLVAYLLLAGDETATAEVDLLHDELVEREVSESYLVYYCKALWTAEPALRGDLTEALVRHRRMADLVRSIKWPCAPYLRRRQQLLDDLLVAAIGSGGAIPVHDRVLLDRHPDEIGACWPYYGRLVPLVELSFWSDS